MYNDVLDCLTSLRAIYLKKLSTAHDEEVTSAKMLEDYNQPTCLKILKNNDAHIVMCKDFLGQLITDNNTGKCPRSFFRDYREYFEKVGREIIRQE